MATKEIIFSSAARKPIGSGFEQYGVNIIRRALDGEAAGAGIPGMGGMGM